MPFVVNEPVVPADVDLANVAAPGPASKLHCTRNDDPAGKPSSATTPFNEADAFVSAIEISFPANATGGWFSSCGHLPMLPEVYREKISGGFSGRRYSDTSSSMPLYTPAS